jgi:hypothetical protein
MSFIHQQSPRSLRLIRKPEDFAPINPAHAKSNFSLSPVPFSHSKKKPPTRLARGGCYHKPALRIDLLVFWLPDQPPPALPVWVRPDSGIAGFVPGYSGGTAPDLHRVPWPETSGPQIVQT